MERSGIEKIAKNPEDRLLLAKLWDKINAGVRKNIPANTCFLAPRELELAGFLFGNLPGLYRFGGYVEPGRCLFFVTAEITPYVLDNLREAGRTKLHLKQLPLLGLSMPEPEFQEIRDTMASIRLDSVIASGFRIGRSLAADYVNAGKVSIDGLPCEKPDKTVSVGSKISVRGLGKIKLSQIGGRTKKDRIAVTIQKYV